MGCVVKIKLRVSVKRNDRLRLGVKQFFTDCSAEKAVGSAGIDGETLRNGQRNEKVLIENVSSQPVDVKSVEEVKVNDFIPKIFSQR